MREVRVYDGEKRVVWPSSLGPAEHAVFYVDAETGHYRTPEGLRLKSHWDRTCDVFDGLDEARRHAHAVAERAPSVACRIFAAADPDVPVEVVAAAAAERRGDPRRARRRIAWGAILIAFGILGIWIDWLFDWFYVLGVVIGTKFLIFGVARLVEGLSERHAARRAAALRRDAGQLVGVADDVDPRDPVRADVQ